MVTEIEKQFFDKFEIRQIDYKGCSWGGYCPFEEHIDCGECSYWETWKTDYPEITSEILLELICILAKAKNEMWGGEPHKVDSCNIEDLKKSTLFECLLFDEKIKDQVHTLFEVENDR